MTKNVDEGKLPSLSTEHIGRQAAENILHAFDYAKFIGKPLNTHITINLRDLADDRMAAAVFSDIRRRFRSWLKYALESLGAAPLEPIYVYVLEAPDGGYPHVHWVVHVPSFLKEEFAEKSPLWVERATRKFVGAYDVDLDPVDPMTDKTLAKYILKGADRRYHRYLHLSRVAKPQGRVWGRRATASPAVGRTARKRAGFVPKRDRKKWLISASAA